MVLDEVDALLRPPYDQEIDAIMDATPRGMYSRRGDDVDCNCRATNATPEFCLLRRIMSRRAGLLVGVDREYGLDSEVNQSIGCIMSMR